MSLDYAGTLTATYPAYEDGWRVTAEPDGTLYDENGDEYSYLFWEGEDKTDYDFSTSFSRRKSAVSAPATQKPVEKS